MQMPHAIMTYNLLHSGNTLQNMIDYAIKKRKKIQCICLFTEIKAFSNFF